MRVRTIGALVGLVLVMTAMPVGPTRADRGSIVSEEEWTDLAQLRMAQAFIGEADGHAPDHEAIAWVLYRRWKIRCRNKGYVSLATFIYQYSSPLKVDLPRARMIRALPWGDATTGIYTRPNLRERWRKARKRVIDWQSRRIKDPCPKALHWGGTMDKPSGHWFPVSCGRTRNIFYGIRRQPKERG